MADAPDGEKLAELVEACDKYPYHELVAYAVGITIGELRDYLERGAAATEGDLREFTRDYCQRDAEFAAATFGIIKANSEAGMRGNMQQLWAWFDKRWPCQNPLAITTLLASERVAELSLDEGFRPGVISRSVNESLHRTGWFHASELSEPHDDLARLLEQAGYRRESSARPGPHPAPESS